MGPCEYRNETPIFNSPGMGYAESTPSEVLRFIQLFKVII